MRERWFSASTSWLSARLSAVWNKTFTRLRITSVLSHEQRQLLKTTLTFITYVKQLRSSEIVAYLKIVRENLHFYNLLMISTKQIAFIFSHISFVHNPPPPGTCETLHQSLSQKILRCRWIKINWCLLEKLYNIKKNCVFPFEIPSFAEDIFTVETFLKILSYN